jgi:hypothetical protein
MKSNEVGTTLKHPETINGNVKNLSKRMKMKGKGECHFYFKNLILPLISILLASLTTFSALARLLLLCSPNPTLCLQKDALKLKKKVGIGLYFRPAHAQKIFSIIARYYRDIYDNIATFSKFRKPRDIFADIIAKLNFADNIVNRAILSRCW